MSPTTPTTVIQALVGRSGPPIFNRRPTGSPPGKYRFASVSLTITAAGAFSSSRSLKKRPLTSGAPIVEKYVSLTKISGPRGADRQRRGSHPRQGLQSLEEPGVEVPLLRAVRILRLRQRQTERQQMRR